jgi:hypothetical protein
VMTLRLCRELIPMCGKEIEFRKLTGTTRAFPDFDRIFGNFHSGQAKCLARFGNRASLRSLPFRRIH